MSLARMRVLAARRRPFCIDMFRFSSGVKGMCMNLEAGQVGVVLFGSDRLVKQGETVKRTGEIVWIPLPNWPAYVPV